MKRTLTNLIAAYCVIIASAGCRGGSFHSAGDVMPDTTQLRDGDLLFRMGDSAESDFVSFMSTGEYSHIGLACQKDGRWCAIHAVPGESEKDVPDYLKCEPIAEFFRKDRALAGGSARVKCSDAVAKGAVNRAMDKVQKKVEFDHDYALGDSTKLYCTELVRHVYLPYGIDLAEERRHILPIPGSISVYIFPQDVWVSNWVENRKQF